MKRESQVLLNVVTNVEQLQKDVEMGRWSEVLPALSHLRLPLNKLMNLYEQIVLEMLEVREVDVARTMMKETAVLVKMKQTVPERFRRLENLVNHVGGDGVHAKAAFTSNEEEMVKVLYAGGGRKESRRKEIAIELMHEIPDVEPSRLLALMTKALKYSREHEELFPTEDEEATADPSSSGRAAGDSSVSSGPNSSSLAPLPKKPKKFKPLSSQYDLFLGRFPLEDAEEEEKQVKAMASQLNFKTSQSAPETVRFSPDGTMLLTGARDGFIEVYNPHTCRLREDLDFQKEENFMALSSAIMAFGFNKTAQYLVAGTQEGTCAIFRLGSGECVKEIAKIHSAPITSLQFAKDDAAILSASLDGDIHLTGLKSGKVIKSFSSSSSSSTGPSASSLQAGSNNPFVVSAHFSKDNSQVVAAYADGLIRVFATNSTRILHTFEPGDHPLDVTTLPNDPYKAYASNSASDRNGGQTDAFSDSAPLFQKSRDIHSLLPLGLPGQHSFVVGTKSNCLFLMNSDGQTIKIYRNEAPITNSGAGSSAMMVDSSSIAQSQLPSGAYSSFVTACLSPQAHLLYAVTQDSFLVCFDVLTAQRLHTFKLHDSEVIGLHHHPFRNLLMSFAVDGSLKTWKP